MHLLTFDLGKTGLCSQHFPDLASFAIHKFANVGISVGPIRKIPYWIFHREVSAVTRNAARNLSRSTRCLVLAMVISIPTTAPIPTHCSGHPPGDRHARACGLQEASSCIDSCEHSVNRACCHYRVMGASPSRSDGLSGACLVSADCRYPDDCGCRQSLPTPPARRSIPHLQSSLHLLSSAGLCIAHGGTPNRGKLFAQNQSDHTTTPALRCALLCRFLV